MDNQEHAVGYYGHYRASTTGQTGCVKEFITVFQATQMYPPQVMYDCDLCHTSHGFRLLKTHMVSTPSQHRGLEAFCASHKIEMGVELP